MVLRNAERNKSECRIPLCMRRESDHSTRLDSRGRQLSENHEDEKLLWREKSPILQQRDNEVAFTKGLLLEGLSPAKRGWYQHSGPRYKPENRNNMSRAELEEYAAKLLKPMIDDIIAKHFL